MGSRSERRGGRSRYFLAPAEYASVTGYNPTPSSQGTTLPGVSIFAQPESMPDSPESDTGKHRSSPDTKSNRTSPEVKATIRSSPPDSKYRRLSGSNTQSPSPPSAKCSTPITSVINGSSSSPKPSGGTTSPATTTTASHPMVSTTLPLTTRSSVDLTDLPFTLNIRQLAKVKRFLATLIQFGNDISPEVSERVHAAILALVSSSISIEEFSQKIQEITNYPLRPFVRPFLETHLPFLQAELVHFARLTKQTPQQYLRHHEHFVLDPHHQAGDAFEIFQPDSKEGIKRRTPDSRSKENGHPDVDGPPPPKRGLHQPSLGNTAPRISAPPSGNAHSLHTPPGYRVYEEAMYRDRFDRFERCDREFHPRPYFGLLHRDYQEDRDMEDAWKNINTMLNCILGMVEKTKRAISILQHRNQTDRQDFTSLWSRRHLDTGAEFDLKKRSDLIASHFAAAKTTELDRVSEVRRRAEEAVNEVKRQAVVELQKAVTAAESKASELVAAERTKMERLINEARRQAAEEALAAINQQEDSTEQNCWNCGRKASETCSGCNTARYCGSFCQHKDWENHHKVCGSGTLTAQSAGNNSPEAPTGAADKRRSPSPLTPKKSGTTGNQSAAETPARVL